MTIAADLRESALSKAATVVIATSVLVLIGLLVAGMFSGEILGNMAFGMLTTSVGVLIATVISLKAPHSTHRFVRALWIAWAVTVLLVGLLLGPERGGATVIMYSMAIVSFPVGLVAIPLAGVASSGLPAWMAIILLWTVAAGLGYAQWFLVLAKLRPSAN